MEAQPDDLVERRVRFGEARHAAPDRHDESREDPGAASRGVVACIDELRFCTLDPFSQVDIAEEGRPAAAHGLTAVHEPTVGPMVPTRTSGLAQGRAGWP